MGDSAEWLSNRLFQPPGFDSRLCFRLGNPLVDYCMGARGGGEVVYMPRFHTRSVQCSGLPDLYFAPSACQHASPAFGYKINGMFGDMRLLCWKLVKMISEASVGCSLSIFTLCPHVANHGVMGVGEISIPIAALRRCRCFGRHMGKGVPVPGDSRYVCCDPGYFDRVLQVARRAAGSRKVGRQGRVAVPGAHASLAGT